MGFHNVSRQQPKPTLLQRIRKFTDKYDSLISVLFTIGPTVIKFMSKTIIKRVALATVSLSALGLSYIADQEDFRGNAYLDDAGVATVGFGSTDGVRMGDTITVRKALSRLVTEVRDEYEEGVRQCAGDVLISQGEYDVYLPVTYNIGVHGFCTSTILKRLKAEDYEGACAAIKMWNKITVTRRNPETGKLERKKVVSRGLSNLREIQYQRCMKATRGE